MLRLTLTSELFDAQVIELEHSLHSLSKWESIHEKPFFGREAMNEEETISYVEQMLTSPPPGRDWVSRLDPIHYSEITNYINAKQTATTFREDPNQPKSSEQVTSELIYYWMIGFQIPFEADRWHLNRLMTLIKICGIKQSKPKKMSKAQQMAEYRRINEERRKSLGTSG